VVHPRPGGHSPSYTVVIPTLGRPCLQDCLDALAAAAGPLPHQVVLADDRRDTPDPLPVRLPPELAGRTVIVTLEGRGPAAARNAGWRAAQDTEWVAFLDDDVVVGPSWRARLAADLAAQPARVAGVQGAITVPRPPGRRPTDWECGTAGLATARWITADMAYRRRALIDAGGFDERFPRAFREDADLALRVLDRGWFLAQGGRETTHPVRPPRRWASLRAQAGNADDALMTRRHGQDWYGRAEAAPGRRAGHWVITALAAATGTALAASGLIPSGPGPAGPAPSGLPTALRPGRRAGSSPARIPGPGRRRVRAAAAVAGLAWLAATVEFAAARIRPGPRTPAEVTEMIITSALIPPLAAGQWTRGWWRARRAGPWPPRPAAVLFDRDGTLVRDVPHNGRPELVEPMPGAAAATARLRRAGMPIGVVTNQSGIGRGMITAGQTDMVNHRIDDLLGPIGSWAVCPHGPDDGCDCRKPSPRLVEQAAADLGVDPADCVVIGDIGTDAGAAYAAGARAIMVPTPQTRPEETVGVPVAPSLPAAVRAVLDGVWPPSWS
jgi:histidinol-phosphate phosphatase family protein